MAHFLYRCFLYPFCFMDIISRRHRISLFMQTISKVDAVLGRISIKKHNQKNVLGSCLLFNGICALVVDQYMLFDVHQVVKVIIFHCFLVGCVLQFNTFVLNIVGRLTALNAAMQDFGENHRNSELGPKLILMSDVHYLLTIASRELDDGYRRCYFMLVSGVVWGLVSFGYQVSILIFVDSIIVGPRVTWMGTVLGLLWCCFWLLLVYATVNPCAAAFAESMKFNLKLTHLLTHADPWGFKFQNLHHREERDTEEARGVRFEIPGVVRDAECVATPLPTVHPRSGTSSDTLDDSSLDRYIDAAVDRAVRTIDESTATVNHLTATTPDLFVNRVVDTPYRHANATNDTDIGTPNRHTDIMMKEIIGTPTRHTIVTPEVVVATPEVVVATPDVVIATPNTVVATPDRHTNTNVAMVVATPDMVVATPNEHTIATFDTVLATPENKNEIKFSEISTTSQIEPAIDQHLDMILREMNPPERKRPRNDPPLEEMTPETEREFIEEYGWSTTAKTTTMIPPITCQKGNSSRTPQNEASTRLSSPSDTQRTADADHQFDRYAEQETQEGSTHLGNETLRDEIDRHDDRHSDRHSDRNESRHDEQSPRRVIIYAFPLQLYGEVFLRILRFEQLADSIGDGRRSDFYLVPVVLYKMVCVPICLYYITSNRRNLSKYSRSINSLPTRISRISKMSLIVRDTSKYASFLLPIFLLCLCFECLQETSIWELVINATTQILAHIPVICIVRHFVHFVDRVNSKLKILIDALADLGGFHCYNLAVSNKSATLALMSDDHYKISVAATHLNNAYAPQYFTLVSGAVCVLIVNFYKGATFLFKSEFLQSSQQVCWTSFWLLLISTTILPAARASRMSNEFNIRLAQLLVQGGNNSFASLEDHETIVKLRIHADFNYTVKFSCGFFELDRFLMHSILGGICSFSIILVQISPDG
ncbi:hypothetical protein GE061_005557 [Apolygus lucorum]|uniref:Gustatory receptor n=1 Tax=Apolygus lucorum TaxID=248454 RepID=A0A8S9WVZ4_APOLU|nr:hypothetical protein GE061_005557 [Apolygus lucorum]